MNSHALVLGGNLAGWPFFYMADVYEGNPDLFNIQQYEAARCLLLLAYDHGTINDEELLLFLHSYPIPFVKFVSTACLNTSFWRYVDVLILAFAHWFSHLSMHRSTLAHTLAHTIAP